MYFFLVILIVIFHQVFIIDGTRLSFAWCSFVPTFLDFVTHLLVVTFCTALKLIHLNHILLPFHSTYTTTDRKVI